MGSEVFTPRPPDVSFAAAGVQPQTQVYVTCDESLVIDTWSSTAPAALTITARVLTPQGRIDTLRWSHMPNSDRSRATSYFSLSEGWLLSVIVDATGLAYRRGQCWCELSLMRGRGSNGVLEAVLLADYIAGTARLGWPGGFVRSSIEAPGRIYNYIGSAPAVGAELIVTVPTNALWNLLGLLFSLSTSAVAGNRLPVLIIDDGAVNLQHLEPQVWQTAGQVLCYNWAPGLPFNAMIGNTRLLPLPTGMRLPSGFRICTSTNGLDVGDQYSGALMLLEEWIQP